MTLDEIHELEAKLTSKQKDRYVKNLVQVARRLKPGQIRNVLETDFVVIHANVEQRQEAYTLTKQRKLLTTKL